MINKLNELDFFKARDILTTELETHGVIGKLILRDYHNFDNLIRIMCRELEIALSDNTDEESSLMSIEMFRMLQGVAYKMPIYILTHPDYYWNNFLSAFIVIYDNYLSVQMEILSIIEQRVSEEEFLNDYSLIKHDVDKLKTEVFPALKNLNEFGVTLKDVVVMAQSLTQELYELRYARPVSMQLSEAYLKALNLS